MFHVPTNAIYRRIGRRRFLELGGGAASALGMGSVAVGLNSVITRTPAYAASSDDAKWKQYSGSKLVFMSENTPPSFAIRDNLKPFYDLTGIEVEILTDDLPVVQQKIGIDLRGGKADFQLNYVQDKPIGAPFADFFANLLDYTKDDTLPQDPEGYGQEVWFENFLDACGSMYTRERLIAFPYDAAVACTFYRQDLFEQHGKDFEKEYGYRMEFTPDTTWKQLYEFAAFFKKLRAAGQDVPYGYAQHQGSFAWTTQLDIQRLLFSHGQWTEFDVDDKLGSKTPGPTNWGDEQSVLLMQKFKDLADVSHPGQPGQRHPAAEHGLPGRPDRHAGAIPRVRSLDRRREASRAAGGKTAYVPCPKGEKSWLVGDGMLVNGTNCGIGGIGINGNASDDLKRAAYIFSIWATSKSTQFNVLSGVGGTPTRKSVLQIPEVAGARDRPTNMPNALTFAAVYDFGIKDPNFVLGPEDPGGKRVPPDHPRPGSEVHSGKETPEEACKAIKEKTDDLNDA